MQPCPKSVHKLFETAMLLAAKEDRPSRNVTDPDPTVTT